MKPSRLVAVLGVRVAFGLLLAAAASTAWAQVRSDTSRQSGDGGAAPLVIGQTFTISSRVLHERRRINVYLPPVYVDSASVRLPVLYMPDGGLAEDFLHVAGLVQVLVGNGTMRPFILVGIENTERRRDLTGPTQNAQDRRIAPRVGGSAEFRRFIRSELMPRIRSSYRTTDETAIVGESLAGLFVIETLLVEPDLFDTYIAFDPSLWWNDERLTAAADELLRKQRGARKRLFFAISSATGAPALAQRFNQVLEQHGNPALTWQYQYFPDETHATIYHPAALRAFREMFKPGA
jgi:predicted alpha/beta superfamily hydrolase